jgi:hypothetical protein
MTSSREIVTVVVCLDRLPAATKIGAIDTSPDDRQTGITQVLSNRYPPTFAQQLSIEQNNSCRISAVDGGDDRLLSAVLGRARKFRQ